MLKGFVKLFGGDARKRTMESLFLHAAGGEGDEGGIKLLQFKDALKKCAYLVQIRG